MIRKITLFILLLSLCSSVSSFAKSVESDNNDLNFNLTLRVNLIFSGNAKESNISLYSLESYKGWWGRRYNLDRVPLKGNGQITLSNEQGTILYKNTFSTLFQEWQYEEEAKSVTKSFENVFLLPMPQSRAVVSVVLYGKMGEVLAEYSFKVDPNDILIKPHNNISFEEEFNSNTQKKYALNLLSDSDNHIIKTPYKYIHKGGKSKDCIDIAIVAEGYTKNELEKFYSNAEQTVNSILEYEPFRSFKNNFNFIAVAPESVDSGVSIPGKNIWLNTALNSHFNTFYSDRYLTTLKLFKLHDNIAEVPYEHIIILANTDNYGGGGIYNSYVLSAASNRYSSPVVVHEFGHSFAGLADEYFYDDASVYNSETEPWEANITTLKDFNSKWGDLVDNSYRDKDNNFIIVSKEQQTKEWLQNEEKNGFKVGIYEGGGYTSKGVYRPYPTCRMRDNMFPTFCPICQRAIKNLIEFNIKQID